MPFRFIKDPDKNGRARTDTTKRDREVILRNWNSQYDFHLFGAVQAYTYVRGNEGVRLGDLCVSLRYTRQSKPRGEINASIHIYL